MEVNTLSRRSFFKGSVAVAALGGLTMAGCSSEQPMAATGAATGVLPEKWDREVDVIVVGTGTILPAALRAHDSGLETLIIEKHPTHFGGTSYFHGGGCSCPNSTVALESGAPEIPRELCKEYMVDTSEGRTSDTVLEAMLENYVPAIDYLADECDFPISYFSGTTMPYSVYTPLSVLDKDFGGVQGHVGVEPTEDGKMLGRAWTAYFKDAIDERGIEVLMGTAAKQLIYNGNPQLEDGEVVGLYAETENGTIAVKARYAVILGTGGFDHNKAMMEAFIPNPMYATNAIETNTGDGHLMAMELGADLRNMKESFRMAFTPIEEEMNYAITDLSADDGKTVNTEQSTGRMMLGPGQAGSIVVNRHGQRFVDESTSYDCFGRGFELYDPGWKEWRNIPGFLIFDKTYKGLLGNGMPTLQQLAEKGEPIPDYVAQYDTLEALADGEGIDKSALLATVERYNGFCETGVDLDWNRGVSSWDRFTCGDPSRVESGELKNPCLAPLNEGPFYCMKLYPGLMQTKGGLVINENAQVMNVQGNPIPRLYAGSNCIANIMGPGYGWGGCTTANGYIVGYIAANHVATLESWEQKAE
ncbi:FAD-binding protein [Adlercreutzia sp. R25]|uniref:FAD-binding protein n=1 Tax=Adlercreutzia shanghongiae TaxID=3111773 RepID=A0ABU6IVN7_9ACTN|nr:MULTISPECIES: FAD-binding protein [unclassified Adlercreutzia]MEC4272175.1 FAD-binding protein [Adlercreutzia sp. R25]MEC4293898.1 FAD-binding protein [Adlercreutzia sp. R22]